MNNDNLEQPTDLEWPRVDRRQSWRIKISVSLISASGGRMIPGFTEDMGGGGCRILTPYELPANKKLQLIIPDYSTTFHFQCIVIESVSSASGKDWESRLRWREISPETIDDLLKFLFRKLV